VGTGIHEYVYYDTRTRPVNMRVFKIIVPITRRYPFTIFISYLLRVLSADTWGYGFFDILCILDSLRRGKVCDAGTFLIC